MKTKLHLQMCKNGNNCRCLLNDLIYDCSKKSLLIVWDQKHHRYFLIYDSKTNELEFDGFFDYNDLKLIGHDYLKRKYQEFTNEN